LLLIREKRQTPNYLPSFYARTLEYEWSKTAKDKRKEIKLGKIGTGAPIPTETQRQRWKEIGIPRYYLQIGKTSRDGSSSYKFGISIEEVRKIRNSECSVCQKQAPSEIDHDHVCLKCKVYSPRRIRGRALCRKCGEYLRVRGPLCRRHNTQIGFLESIMREGSYEKMVQYLKEYI
jgi:hypothetical protein